MLMFSVLELFFTYCLSDNRPFRVEGKYFCYLSRNTILNKNKECKIDFKSKKYDAIASDGIDLLSKLLEKNPEKRITPAEALNHPFLVKDRPIFKFKKVFSDQKENLY